MVGFRIFKIFNENKSATLDRLYNFCGREMICDSKNNVIFIPYQYSRKSRELVIQIEKEVGVKKYFFTNENFYEMFNLILNDKFTLQKINLTEELEECSQYLRKYINELNTASEIEDKKNVVKRIKEELEWAYNEEEIYVKSVEIRLKDIDVSLQFKVEKYGEVEMDLENMKESVLQLVSDSLL